MGALSEASGCLSPLKGCVRDVQSGSEMLCHRLYRGFGPAVTQARGIRPALAPWTHHGPLDGSAADPRRTYGPPRLRASRPTWCRVSCEEDRGATE